MGACDLERLAVEIVFFFFFDSTLGAPAQDLRLCRLEGNPPGSGRGGAMRLRFFGVGWDINLFVRDGPRCGRTLVRASDARLFLQGKQVVRTRCSMLSFHEPQFSVH